MNEDKNTKDKVDLLLREAQNIAVIPSPNRGLDSFYAGAGLFYMLRNLNKNVNFIFTKDLPQNFESIIKPEYITKDIKNRDLLVSIDYSDTTASKVDYSTSQNVLYIKVGPINKDFNKDEKVKVRVVGFDFDLIFIIGANNLLELGDSFKNLDTLSKISKIINIDNSNNNGRYGYMNIVDTSASSLSLLLMQKSPFWGLKFSDQAARLILKGISAHR